jgi:hypothetical protein
MVCCKNCNAWFKDSFNLKRHMSRKRPCEDKNILEDLKKEPLDPKKELLDPKKELLDNKIKI